MGNRHFNLINTKCKPIQSYRSVSSVYVIAICCSEGYTSPRQRYEGQERAKPPNFDSKGGY